MLTRTAHIPLGLLVAVAAACHAPAIAEWPPAHALQVAADQDCGPLPPSVRAAIVADGRWRCTFRYKPENPVQAVTIAGSFNDWKKDAMPLAGPDADGGWTATVELPAGVHLYKFVVDDAHWIPDPLNPESEHDGHSGQNSILRLGHVAQLRQSSAVSGDGRIEGRALEHRPERPLYFQPLSGGRALVRLRTLSHDVERVSVVVRDGGRADMSIVSEREPFSLWEGVVPLAPSGGTASEASYVFVLADGALTVSSPESYGAPVSPKDVFQTPEWAKHAIWYQIFLDRFRNGNPGNDRPPTRPWTSEWFTPSPWEREREAQGESFYKFYVFDRQYGGDIDGLESKLPYLKDLGVNAIYLCPIFKAESNHKYNAETYLHVDDHFGTRGDYEAVAATEDHNDPSTWRWTETDKRFLKFLKTAHKMGFRVIIDGVFNHVGTAHPAFQDVKKNGRSSKYADWFNVTSWEPFKYEGWFGHDALPVFRKSHDGLASEQVKQYIFNVTRRWMDPDGDGDPSDGIDGWRLDVPNEIPAPFWVEWRKVVKSVNPDAYITGEIWDRAEQWLDGKHFDAVMNYEFARATVAWMFDRKWKVTPSAVDQRLRELRLAYPHEAMLVLQNLINSHDTDRLASMAFNPDRAFDHGNRPQDNGPDYNNAKPDAAAYQKARLAGLLQMTYVGAPMVYYGDEAGIWGADDPTCRKPMLWKDLEPYDKPDENFVMDDQLAHYRQIVALRNAHPALRTGTFRTLLTDDDQDVWAFLRKDNDEQLIVALNASPAEAEVEIPVPPGSPNRWRGVFNVDGTIQVSDQKVRVRVPGVGGVVLHAATPK